jgi:hypothetical protein
LDTIPVLIPIRVDHPGCWIFIEKALSFFWAVVAIPLHTSLKLTDQPIPTLGILGTRISA